MKRVELIKAIEGLGCVLVRHGAKHDWYRNPRGLLDPIQDIGWRNLFAVGQQSLSQCGGW